MKATHIRGTLLIPDHEIAPVLANLPIKALGLPEDPLETFAVWGIRTLGELAALPEVELITRLGPNARAWRELARGEHPHMFQPLEPAFTLREFCEFETPVENADSLLFIGARMLECLVTRGAQKALSLAVIHARMQLEGEHSHAFAMRPAIPSTDRKFLLKLLQLELDAHPPPAAVIALELTAEAGRSGTVQLGLFAPQMPEPSRLDVTLARLRAIVGEGRVGSPVLEDTHRPGSFRMESFTPSSVPAPDPIAPRMALRRVRPSLPVRVFERAEKPAEFRDRDQRFVVLSA